MRGAQGATYAGLAILVVLLISLMPGLAKAATDTNYPKQNITNNKATVLTYHDYVPVIIHFESNTTESTPSVNVTKKSLFFPRVDQFSALRVNGSSALLNLNTTIYVWVEILVNHNVTNTTFNNATNKTVTTTITTTWKSEKRTYITADGHFAGYLSLIVQAYHGEILSLAWDSDCGSCSGHLCIEGVCTTKVSDLAAGEGCFEEGGLKIDPFRCCAKIYLAWVGTDKNKKNFQSVSKVPSRFNQFSWFWSTYDAAAGFWKDFTGKWGHTDDN